MVKANDLLPIGSVVLLNNGVKELMIYGVYQTNADDKKQYDYIGVPYPEGNIAPGFTYLFDHEDISEVVFKGYDTDNRKEFLNALDRSMSKQ